MRKNIKFILFLIIISLFAFTGICYAAELEAIDVKIDKTIVNPGEEVKVLIQFGENLGSYTFDVAYDNNLFDYISVDGGTANSTDEKVRVVYFDSTGGENPRSNMSVTFKAKQGITTSNPSEFMVTAEGLANADASVTFDDITTPIVKNVTVEPVYIPYTLKLEYSGDIILNQEKDITISYSSEMGRYYEKARLVADIIKPDGAHAKLLATDQAGLEHDIIDSGWGDTQGYKIGGANVAQVLNTKGTFDKIGDYKISLKLIDRENSDAVIAENTFSITVKESVSTVKPGETTPGTVKPEETVPQTPVTSNKDNKTENKAENNTVNKKPSQLPKTGSNIYIPVVILLALLTGVYVFYNRKK